MTIFGGGNNGIMDIPNDVWVLTNANGLGGQPKWIQLFPAGNLPAARENEAATYDPASNAMTIFGGCCGSSRCVAIARPVYGEAVGGTLAAFGRLAGGQALAGHWLERQHSKMNYSGSGLRTTNNSPSGWRVSE
jgi:hypothetical protein